MKSKVVIQSMDNLSQLVIFTLDEQRYALCLDVVERVVRVVEITPLPETPPIVMGVINMQGQVLPVINIRKRLQLPEREMSLSDQLIIAQTSRGTVGLVVDAVSSVIECPEQSVVAAQEILPGMKDVEGITRIEDHLIFIQDLDKCLSLEEEKMLEEAMENA